MRVKYVLVLALILIAQSITPVLAINIDQIKEACDSYSQVIDSRGASGYTTAILTCCALIIEVRDLLIRNGQRDEEILRELKAIHNNTRLLVDSRYIEGKGE